MDAIRFVLKTLAMTVVVVLLMQIRWGEVTIEEHAMEFLTSSSLVKPIDKTAEGTVKFIRNMWTKMAGTFNTGFSRALHEENRPGSRHAIFNVDRSKAYVSQKAHEVREAVAGDPEARSELKGEAKSAWQKLRDKTIEAKNRVQAKLIDETEVPGKTRVSGQPAVRKSTARSSSSSDDESEDLIEDSQE